jgi:hypothetical protein
MKGQDEGIEPNIRTILGHGEQGLELDSETCM